MTELGKFVHNHPIITFLIIDGVLATVKFITEAVVTKGECFRMTELPKSTSSTN